MTRPDLPAVGVVIATHNRPQLVRAAIASVLEQRYAGCIHIEVVFDRSDPDPTLTRAERTRTVAVRRNDRAPGLAGARNTGILALDTPLVAFCDDDDTWLAGKLTAQLERLAAQPDAEFVTTAMRVDYGTRSTVRLAGALRITVADLARSRMSMLHSSSFLFRRSAMLDGFGLVDETIPRSMGEDWDLLLRAARQRPIEHVDEPLVAVLWGASSYFNEAWADKNAAAEWLLEHHPEIRADPVGLGLQLGKVAFGNAALKQRPEAWAAIKAALRANHREPRAVVALLVLAGASPEWIINTLNKRGHGI